MEQVIESMFEQPEMPLHNERFWNLPGAQLSFSCNEGIFQEEQPRQSPVCMPEVSMTQSPSPAIPPYPQEEREESPSPERQSDPSPQ